MNKTIILIAGPTAVGKTSVAIQLASHFQTEIISADSRQCFNEINIGVAKPSLAELQQVKHHFINAHSIHEPVTAASYERSALQAATDIFEQHSVGILVGGTGLYIQAFCNGMDPIPPVNEELREELQQQYQQQGLAWLQQEVKYYDPLFAEKGEMQNPQRMLRALEVAQSTGTSILGFQKGAKQERDFQILKIGLNLPREELYDRINQRVDQMMEAGLLNEAREVYPLRHLNALQTVGYKELFDYFEEKYSLEQAISKIKQNSRHYAKRQLTWFRRDADIKWFHPAAVSEIQQYITQQLLVSQETGKPNTNNGIKLD